VIAIHKCYCYGDRSIILSATGSLFYNTYHSSFAASKIQIGAIWNTNADIGASASSIRNRGATETCDEACEIETGPASARGARHQNE